MIKKILLLINLVFLSSIAAHAQPVEDCQNLYSLPQGDDEWFERVRCYFGENNGVYAEDHNRLTLAVLPSFEDTWLIVLESHPSLAVERSDTLRVGLLETTEIRFARSIGTLGDFIFIDNGDPMKGAIFHERLIQDRYTKSLELERLEPIFDQLVKSILEKGLSLNAMSGCNDGTTIFVEIVDQGKSQLLRKHNCDDDYTEFLSLLAPLADFAIEEMGPLENELSDLKAELFEQ